MYFEGYYNFALCTPIFPLALILFYDNSGLIQLKKILILLFSVDLLTNLLTTYFETEYGNVFPVTNVSLIIQTIIILQLINSIEKLNKRIVNISCFFILVVFLLESIVKSNFWIYNSITLISSHVLVILIGWIALYRSYKETSEFEFRILAINILYNTVFFIDIMFEDKIQFSRVLYQYLFLLTTSLYIGANLLYGHTIWSLRKN